MQRASSQLALTGGVATRSFASITANPETAWRQWSAIPTLAEYAADWLAGISGLVRPQTLEAYTYRLEQHVVPYLGAQRLDEITVDDILGLIGELREKGLSGGSIRSMLTPLSRLFSHAVRRDVIAVNPISKLDRTERPGSWMREQRVLNRDEIGRLLDAAPPQYRTLRARKNKATQPVPNPHGYAGRACRGGRKCRARGVWVVSRLRTRGTFPARRCRPSGAGLVVVLAVEWQDSEYALHAAVPPVCHASRNATPCMTHAALPVWFAVAA
jgi:Phage integrase, N-terminal SAM-like domain